MSGSRLAIGKQLKRYGDPVGQNYLPCCHLGSIGQDFNPCFDGTPQPAAVLAIDFVGGAKALAIRSLNDKNDGGAVAVAFEAHQFP